MSLVAASAGPHADLISSHIRDVPDFPEPGILFKDITGLLVDPEGFRAVIDALAHAVPADVDLVAGMEARGFILGAALAAHLGKGFVPIRKAGKLPPPTHAVTYDLEYGQACLELREGTVRPGVGVLLVDDVLATGGTAAAAAQLVEAVGARVVGLAFLLELTALDGRSRLAGREVSSILATAP
ncbi:adenine phosphoribosyltransferase [Sanguibacter antarcticus]|uniref:Adenine phosphoribosyltransferase n=1 Tax=Sanguibacter antarcticus TaxID=372484 RepID=A0A2A9E4A4_9MICO|nr:adenine phosphoribosyltransferase [Sanguibacter antarcticus]PFG33072.1 adenine phosphoribosyltransferase [Sanguibacter antarcticus]